MQRETVIHGIPFTVISSSFMGIGEDSETDSMWVIPRDKAPELIAFIQQWIDYDPEQELRSTILDLMEPAADENVLEQNIADIIAAVREHDATYRRET